MKKLVSLLALAFYLSANAQYVTIPDAKFVAWLQANTLAMNGNQMDTTNSTVTTLTKMNLAFDSIRNLYGVQYFDSLKVLDCDNNVLVSIPKLPSKLKTFICNNNQLDSLPLLPNSLDTLKCYYNQIISLPNLPNNLTWLECYFNQLTILPPLPNSLTYFSCVSNQLLSLPPLPNSLYCLDCSSNQFTSLPTLPSSLQQLYCRNNQLTTLPVLPNTLSWLYCDYNDIQCFPPFPNSIGYLIISNNPFTCLPNYVSAMDVGTLGYPLCTGGNLYGCTSSGTCLPTIDYTLTPDSLPHNWDVNITYLANVTNARWYWGDGTDTLALYPSHTYSVAGIYDICVTAYSSCGDSASYCQNDSIYRTTSNTMIHVSVLQSTTGISQISGLNANTSIYPNPNNGSFVIEPSNATKQTIQVYDVSGKLVLSQIINGKTSIDASSLNEGVYNISLQSNEGVVNKRLVIVR